MACSEIHRKLLSPAGMQRIRAAIIREYQFLIHCAPLDAVSSISQNGLRPHFPGADTYADMEYVRQFLGVQNPQILCFTPPDIRIKPGVELAIASGNLPS